MFTVKVQVVDQIKRANDLKVTFSSLVKIGAMKMVKLDFEKKDFLDLGNCITYNTYILYKICDEFMSLCVNFNGFVQRSVDISDVL